MATEIREEWNGSWFFPGTVKGVYEDGERVGEIREETETHIFSPDETVEVFYNEQGHRESETRQVVDKGIFWDDHYKETRDTSGHLMSTTRAEVDNHFFVPDDYVHRTYDADNNLIYESRGETRGGLIARVLGATEYVRVVKPVGGSESISSQESSHENTKTDYSGYAFSSGSSGTSSDNAVAKKISSDRIISSDLFQQYKITLSPAVAEKLRAMSDEETKSYLNLPVGIDYESKRELTEALIFRELMMKENNLYTLRFWSESPKINIKIRYESARRLEQILAKKPEMRGKFKKLFEMSPREILINGANDTEFKKLEEKKPVFIPPIKEEQSYETYKPPELSKFWKFVGRHILRMDLD